MEGFLGVDIFFLHLACLRQCLKTVSLVEVGMRDKHWDCG